MPDRRRVAADRITAALQGFDALLVRIGVAPRRVIPLGGLSRDERQSPLHAFATQEQWDRITRRLGIGLVPRFAQDVDALFQVVESLLFGWHRDPELGVLALIPTGADAEQEPSAAQQINRRGLACKQ